VAGCGNGVVDAGEECDDGNDQPLDGCDGACLSEEVVRSPSAKVLSTTLAPPDDAIAATLKAPTAGPLVIIETSATIVPAAGFGFADRQVHVEAPATSPTNPLVLKFTLDAALGNLTAVKVFKNGAIVGPCTLSPWRAFPDPCVSGRIPGGPNQTKIAVNSSAGGEWNFGTRTGLASIDRCLAGTKLMLEVTPGWPARRRFLVRSNDTPELVLGDGTDIPEILAEGGSLSVTAIGGDRFETTYPLAAEGWRPLRPKKPGYGIRYRNRTGPITTVVFKAGRLLEIAGAGSQLVQSLAAEPDLVDVQLQIGQYRYRLEFGAATNDFKANRRLLRRWSSRPGQCSTGALSGD